jgi:tRNA-dihydrouridine synthase B
VEVRPATGPNGTATRRAGGASVRIGGVTCDSPFLLAPLAGVSDSPFRQLAREQGASMVYTEMVSADGLARGNQATLDYCAFEPCERPIGIQIFGSDPGVMAEATRILCDLPAERRPDLIDINMGCPVRKVVNRCAGAALLTNISLVREIVRRMNAVSTVPVTAKIRLGWDGESRNVVEMAGTLEEAGAQAVAIHARTRAEKFEGQAHWEMIAAAKEAVGIPVIGNGDVRTHEDAARMIEQTGCDAVMIGRAAFGDPWVFRRVREHHAGGRSLPPPTARERLEAGLRHLRLMTVSVGPETAAREMRKHVAWYVKGLPRSSAVREQVNRTRSPDEMADLLRAYVEDLEAGRLEGESAPEAAGPGVAVVGVPPEGGVAAE